MVYFFHHHELPTILQQHQLQQLIRNTNQGVVIMNGRTSRPLTSFETFVMRVRAILPWEQSRRIVVRQAPAAAAAGIPQNQRWLIHVIRNASPFNADGNQLAIPVAAPNYASDTNNNPPTIRPVRHAAVLRNRQFGRRVARVANSMAQRMWSLGDYVIRVGAAPAAAAAGAAVDAGADRQPRIDVVRNPRFLSVQRLAARTMQPTNNGPAVDIGPLVIGGGWGPTAAARPEADPDPRDTFQRNYEENNYVVEATNAVAAMEAPTATATAATSVAAEQPVATVRVETTVTETDSVPTAMSVRAVAAAASAVTTVSSSVIQDDDEQSAPASAAASNPTQTHSSGSMILNNVAGDDGGQIGD